MKADITTDKTSRLLVIILVTIVMTVDGLAMFMLYTSAFEQQRESLIATVHSQAQMINAVARFNRTYSNTDYPAGAESATLSQVREALKNYVGFGRTGEINLGKMVNNHVIFLNQSRKSNTSKTADVNQPIPLDSPMAIAMQLALSGRTGTITAIDYSNVEVLAAYEPINELGYGIIAKIDISEVREPFIKAAIISLIVAIIMIMTGSYFFIKIYSAILLRLHKSESYNRRLFETLPAGLLLCDMQGQMTDANPAFANIIGRTVEETKKLSCSDITPEDYAEAEQAQLKSLETTGKYGPYEKEYIHKNGNRIPVRLNGQIVEIDDVKYIWSFIEDISSRIEIENALAYAYELNSQIIHQSPIGMAIYDISGQCIDGNEALANMIGATKEQLLQQNYNTIDEWKKSGLLDIARTTLSTQRKITHEALFTTSFGKEVYLNCHIVPLNIASKKHILLVADDLTELRKRDEKLRDHVIRNELVLSTTQDGYWIVSTDGHIRDANKAYSKMSGYDYNELINMTISDIDCVQTPGKIADTIAEIIQHGFIKFETRHRCKDRTIIDVEVTVSHAMLDGQSTIIAFFKDITERKRNEHELSQHRQNLEWLVAERTRELKNTQQELIRKERLATLGQLTATVSHELRNPLGAIQPSIYILKKKSDTTDTMLQDAIDRIERNVSRCDHIIDELLDFTRIMDINLTAADLNRWLTEIINEHSIPDYINIQYSLDNHMIAHFDTDRLRRAIINILDNAIHAIEENKNNSAETRPHIEISTQRNDDKIIIDIKDNGIGISDEVLGRIFEPLFSTKGFGVGLGMPTVKQIMQQHNGGIDISSARHQGTRVTLWLPANLTASANTGT